MERMKKERSLIIVKERVWYADLIRVIAVGMVILIHVASKDFHRVPIASFHWQFLNVVNGVSRVSVPLLFMVSGMFFLNPGKKIGIPALYKKNIWRLVRIFLFWSVIYLISDTFLFAEPLIGGGVKQTLFQMIKGNFHLWFLYRLLEAYIMVPLMRPIAKDKRLLVYFLSISFIVGFLIPSIQRFPIRSTFILPNDGLNLDITIGYVGYMMAGYALHKYNLPDIWKKRLYLVGILGACVTVLGTSIVSFFQGELYPLFYEYLTPNILVSSLAFFVFVKEKVKNKKFTPKQQQIIHTSSTYSFGVYLVHVLIRNILWKVGLNTTLFTPILSVPLLALLIGMLSFGVTHLLMKQPMLKKTVI